MDRSLRIRPGSRSQVRNVSPGLPKSRRIALVVSVAAIPICPSRQRLTGPLRPDWQGNFGHSCEAPSELLRLAVGVEHLQPLTGLGPDWATEPNREPCDLALVSQHIRATGGGCGRTRSCDRLAPSRARAGRSGGAKGFARGNDRGAVGTKAPYLTRRDDQGIGRDKVESPDQTLSRRLRAERHVGLAGPAGCARTATRA